jgi:hypothetical protein
MSVERAGVGLALLADLIAAKKLQPHRSRGTVGADRGGPWGGQSTESAASCLS